MTRAVWSTLICLALVTVMSGCRKTEKAITSFDAAEHAKIGVMTGSSGEKVAAKCFPDAQVKNLPDELGLNIINNLATEIVYLTVGSKNRLSMGIIKG